MRVLANAPAVLTSTWYAPGSETPVDVDASVLATVTHVNGTVLLNAVTAQHGATGVYTITLPAQSDPFDAVVVWTATLSGMVTKQTDFVQGVGGFFATLAEIRALDGLGSATAFPTSTLIAARDAAETLFETTTGRHWTAKYGREVLDGDPSYRRAAMSVYSISSFQGLYNLSRRLSLGNVRPRRLMAITIDDGAGNLVVQPDLTQFKLYDSGEIERALSSAAWPRGVQNVVAEYIYGEDAPPADLKQAFLRYVRYLLLESSGRIPDRATSMQTDFGSFTIGQARGWDKPTGLSEVDAVLQRYGYRIPVVA